MGCIISQPNVEQSEPVANTPKPAILTARAPEAAKNAEAEVAPVTPAIEAGTDPKINAEAAAPNKPPTATAQAQLAIDFDKVRLVSQGLLKGFLDEAMPHWTELFENSSEVMEAFAEAIDEFETGLNWNNWVAAMGKIADALQLLLDVFRSMSIAGDQLDDLARVIFIFKNPSAIVSHFLGEITVNGADISKNITDAIQAWRDQEWELFGELIGRAIAEVLTVEENVTPWWMGCTTGCSGCNFYGQ